MIIYTSCNQFLKKIIEKQRANETKNKMMKTKNKSKSIIKISILCFSLTLLISTFSCNKNDDNPTCGCNSDIRATIPESANLIGQLVYKRQLDPSDNFYNNKFWITYVEPDCNTCIHHMIVCNENFLSSFNDVKELPIGQSISVQFSGQLKETCTKKFDISSISYEHITLTNIERQ